MAQTSPGGPRDNQKRIVLISANHKDALQTRIKQYADYLGKFPDRLDDFAYTAGQRREEMKFRAACLAGGDTILQPIVPSSATKLDHPEFAFVFTGQGAHWLHMGRDLLEAQPVFKESICSMDAIIDVLEHAPKWSIYSILTTCEDADVLADPLVAQTVCTALQIALVELLSSWGISPSSVIGHSSGEIGAAYASKVLSMREAIITAFYRGYVTSQLPKIGAMAVVGLGAESVLKHLPEGVTVACHNSASTVTLSGDAEPLEHAVDAIQRHHPGVFTRRLAVQRGYHSCKWTGPFKNSPKPRRG